MTIETLFETESYRYDYDTQYGTGWFVRKSDDHVTLLNTGVDAEEERQRFKMMPNDAKHEQDFNELAEAQEYSPRWEK